MPYYCCVPKCQTRGTGHSFPKDTNMRRRWIIAIKRIDPVTKKLWEPSIHQKVCGKHFTEDDYTSTLLGEKRHLKRTAIPSCFPKEVSRNDSMRALRANKRSSITTPQKSKVITKMEDCKNTETVVNNDINIGSECEISTECISKPFQDRSTQTDNVERNNVNSEKLKPCQAFSIFNFQQSPKTIKYYTSFDDFEHFLFFFNLLGPCVRHLGITQITTKPEDQLFLTLMKLRQAKDDFELSILFDIRPNSVSLIFSKWINFLYYQMNELNIWPSSATVTTYMPLNFKKSFPKTRVILDATEIPIQKPHAVGPQRETFSQYKNKNTLKVMIGCTPRGTVSYISDAYGGSVSDRQIIERSDLITNNILFQSKDSIMADRGIMVQDIFSSKNVYVNTPTLLKGKSQLEPEEVHRDRKVASKRIHVERVIGLAKTYKILKKDLNSNLLTLGNRIIQVCFHLCNFRNSIVNKYVK